MFRRRRDAGDGRHEARTGRHERRGLTPDDDGLDEGLAQDEDQGGPDDQSTDSGPWDSRESYPDRTRLDVGSLLIPAGPGHDVGLELSDDQSQFVAVSVDMPDGKLQVRALAAPKTGGLWDDERGGIIETITKAGGQASEVEGPFGPEVRVLEMPDPATGLTEPQPARFVGVDGPRWLLVGKISGPAAARPELIRPLEEVFADIVVVRGDHPAAPRDLLDILLPAEMREALAQQIAESQEQQEGQFLVPTERGPEITETR
ncbi:MAG: DUF3710 domain-containing protein [Streptosporangiaceae bacterium]